jgi:hypothetical protein
VGGSNMKRILIGPVMILVILLFSVLAGPVMAGVEPSPFHDDYNKLGSIINNLESVERRLGFILTHPPDPAKPGLNGEINRLEAMAGELEGLDNRLGGLIGSYPINPEDLPDDLYDAYGEVIESSQGIVDRINLFLRDPTGDPPVEFGEALVGFRTIVQQIIFNVNEFINGKIGY